MIVGAIFVNFKKAFDSISHNILSLKLQAIGLSGNLHEWLMDNLKDRFQYTVVNGHSSNLDEVKYGVPQGSLLCPRLFTININDLTITFGDVFMYADDTTLYYVGKNFDQVCSQLNNILEQLLLWSSTIYTYFQTGKATGVVTDRLSHPENMYSIRHARV